MRFYVSFLPTCPPSLSLWFRLHVCAPGSWKFILIIHGDIDYARSSVDCWWCCCTWQAYWFCCFVKAEKLLCNEQAQEDGIEGKKKFLPLKFLSDKNFLSHCWYVIMLQAKFSTLFRAMFGSVHHFCYNTVLQVTTYYICALKLTSSVSFSFLLVLVFHVNWIFLCTLNVYWSPLFFRKPNLHTSA